MSRLITAMLKDRSPLLGWFGKLPALGDFAGKALPLSLRNQIHTWCAQGMDNLTQQQGENWKAAYQLAPVWRFVMDAHVWDSKPLQGCIAPSMDRIGRYSPLLALRSMDDASIKTPQLPYSHWLQRVEILLRQVIRGELNIENIQHELESALEVERLTESQNNHPVNTLKNLNITTRFSWLNWVEGVSGRKKRSFWWVESPTQKTAQTIIHNGAPDEELFALLMTGWVDDCRLTGH